MSKAFGVGCFHFGYKKSVPFETSAESYKSDVSEALRSLSAVSEIDVSYGEVDPYVMKMEDEPGKLEDGVPFPVIFLFDCRFTILIPARVQQEMFPRENVDQVTGTERFRVCIRHSFYGPVAFVECLNPAERCDPSTGVRLVREYLSRELSRQSLPVKFEFLGPSPFHADFFVRTGDAGAGEVRTEELKQRGYNEIVFVHNVADTPEEILEHVYDELLYELDLFYYIERHRVQMMHRGGEMLREWRELQDAVQPLPSMLNLPRRVGIHRGARNLVLNALSLQAEFADRRRQVTEAVTETYGKDAPRYLEHFVKRNAEELPTYSVQSILEWARHVEEGSFKLAEIAAVIFSALGGGIVGSLITLLASQPH